MPIYNTIASIYRKFPKLCPGSNKRLVQINAWYQAHCLQFITLFFVFQKNAWFNLTPGLMPFENN